MDRLKQGPEQRFYEIQDGENKYWDKSFAGSNAIRWEDNVYDPSKNGLEHHLEFLKWRRMGTEFPANEGYSLWGKNGVSVHDIRQGAIGNCWFIAAASALAEVPERLESLFINPDDGATNGISENGIYSVRFYALMEPIVVTIDDRAPFRNNNA